MKHHFKHSGLTLEIHPLLQVAPDVGQNKMAWQTLQARFNSHEVSFYDAPLNPEISQIEATHQLVNQLESECDWESVLFLGIGGSSLGPLSALSALRDQCDSHPHFHFLENPDPIDWKFTLSKLNPSTTLVVCVTKSGGTFETMAQFRIALEWIGQRRWKSHVIAITDPHKGDLRKCVNHLGFRSLAIHPGLGGRFS